LVTIRCGAVNFANIQAILFDKDGTLEDSQDSLRNLAQKVARLIDAQVPGIGDPLLMSFGINGSTIDAAGLFAVGSRRECEIAAAAYVAETGRSWLESQAIAHRAFTEAELVIQKSAPSPVFPGSLAVLHKLSQAGLKLGILSAAPPASVQSFVQHHQLEDILQLAMGVEDGLSKPDPQLFLQACQRLGVEPNATLMVGDAAGDIEMANRAGAAGSIGICWKPPIPSYLKKADAAIAHLQEIEVV